MDRIYELFQDEHGYINNLDEVNKYLQKNGFNDTEITTIILKIYSNNLEVINTLKKKNKIIKDMTLTTNCTQIKKEENITSSAKKENKSSKEKINTDSYICMLSKDMDESTLEKLIPSDKEGFSDIINMILLELIKTKLDLESWYKSDKELSSLIYEEIEQIESKINLLKDYKNSKTKGPIDVDNIKLIFIPSILEDFASSSIPRELYKDFLSLILSFKKGLPKNFKMFKPGGCNYVISEVRMNGLRILYDKLNDTTYSLYYAFKKSERDAYYHDTLIARANAYYINKSNILNEYYSSNEKYFKLHEEDEKKLIKKLSGDNNETTNK